MNVKCEICSSNKTSAWTSTICGHLFHKECLTSALENSKKCPACNQSDINGTLRDMHLSEHDDDNSSTSSDSSDGSSTEYTEILDTIKPLSRLLEIALDTEDKTSAVELLKVHEKLTAQTIIVQLILDKKVSELKSVAEGLSTLRESLAEELDSEGKENLDQFIDMVKLGGVVELSEIEGWKSLVTLVKGVREVFNKLKGEKSI